jgi:hypothetical protein
VTRPPTPLEMSEQQALVRIAMLASDVLRVLRLPERGRYSSERELRQWLVESGVAYTASDLAPAVGLLELTGRVERGPFSKATSSRAGWLPVHVAYSSGVRTGS